MVRPTSLICHVWRKFLAAFINLVSACMILSSPALSNSLSFAVFGDVYMTPEHEDYLKGMLRDMATKNAALAIFTGGIKPADQGCQDNNLLAEYPVFARAPLPTFYVPGDAEWALCAEFPPEGRLDLLRKTFYRGNVSLGDPSLPLTRQADYPELMRWQAGPALFVSINVTGHNNLWGTKVDASTEYVDRTTAGLSWLKEAFQAAKQNDLSMLVIVMHGNPEFDNPTGSSKMQQGYRSLHDLLKTETAAFKGQVLLAHGGDGVHRIDHPLINDSNNLPYQNFTRVETYGALQQGWVLVSVERNTQRGDDPVTRTEFRFESFPWPPLTDMTGAETQDNVRSNGQ